MRLELSYGEESIKRRRIGWKAWLAAKLHVGFHFPGSGSYSGGGRRLAGVGVENKYLSCGSWRM